MSTDAASTAAGAVPPHLAGNPSYAAQHASLQAASALHAHNEQLKGELAKAVRIAQELQSQNQVLQTAWGKLKSESDELKESYSLVRAQSEAALHAKQNAENECEKLYGVWQEKLEQKQSEFEQIQSSMVPARELDLIRLQILQEASTSHNSQMEELKNEINKFRSLYHETHHNLVLLTNDSNLKTQSHEKEQSELRSRLDRMVGEMQNKNRRLQELVQDTSVQDRARELERNNNELAVKNKALSVEISELTRALVEAKIGSDEAKLSSKSNKVEKDNAEKLSGKAVELAQKNCAELASNLAASQATAQGLREEVLSLQRVYDNLESRAAAEAQEARGENEALRKRIAEMEKNESAASIAAKESLTAAQDRIAQLERRLAEDKTSAEFAARESAALVKALKEEHTCNMREGQHQQELLKEAQQRLQQSMHALELSKNNEYAALLNKFNHVESERAVLESEKNGFDSKLADMRADLEKTASDLTDRTKELHELQIEYDGLQIKHRNLQEKEHLLQTQKDKMELEIETFKGDMNTAIQSLEDERKQYATELNNLRNTARNERKVLLARLEETQQTFQTQHESLRKEHSDAKKDKLKYKKLALGLQGKMNEVLREFAQSKRDASLAADALRFQLNNAIKEKEDAERQRDEYKHRFGAVFPQPLLQSTGFGAVAGFGHTHSSLPFPPTSSASTVAAPLEFSHAPAASISQTGHIDVPAGASAAQKKLAELRSRGAH